MKAFRIAPLAFRSAVLQEARIVVYQQWSGAVEPYMVKRLMALATLNSWN
jgi:hypothetical protein